MIKIDIDENIKREIEKIYLKDAYSAHTGIFKVLNLPNIKADLKNNYADIYNVLYDKVTEKLIEKEVEKLLLANRKELAGYISKFGSYATRKDESDYLLNHVFKYNNYANRKISYDISNKMDVVVCPYFNRQYIFAITPSRGRVRPQFDHYFPKKEYPYLALSLYNMIPSCSICNMAKSSLDTFRNPILYPFDEEAGYAARFEIHIKEEGNYVKVMQGLSEEFVITLDSKQTKKTKEIDRQMEKLHLNELYNKHTEYVMHILKARYVNTLERINEIRKIFPQLFHSNEEVKNMLYMTDLRKELWGKRPLSKLTHDIDMQLDRGSISYVKK